MTNLIQTIKNRKLKENYESKYEKDIYEDIRDPKFANRFLGRLVSDCEYILNACMDAYESGDVRDRKGALRHLWAQNDVDEQISLMRACKRTLDKHGIESRTSYEDINDYESKLKRIEKFNESNSSFQALKKEIRDLYGDIDAYYMINDEYINSFIDEIEHANKDELIDGVNDILGLIDDIDDDSYRSCSLENYKDKFENILNKLA